MFFVNRGQESGTEGDGLIAIACRLTDDCRVVRQHTDQGRPTAEAAIAPLGGNGDCDGDGDGCVAEDKLVAASAEARDVGLPGERAAGVIRGPKPRRSADVDVPVPVAHECLVGLDCERRAARLVRSHVYVLRIHSTQRRRTDGYRRSNLHPIRLPSMRMYALCVRGGD